MAPFGDVVTDSRHVRPDTLFTALRGDSYGRSLVSVEKPLDKGAGVLVVEELPDALWSRVRAEGAGRSSEFRTPTAPVAQLASAYYRHPARQLSMIGITGTNGKTTTAHVVEAILRAAGEPVGMLGTVDYRIGAKRLPAPQDHPPTPYSCTTCCTEWCLQASDTS